MNIILSKILRRQLDTVLNSMEHRSDIELTLEHLDMLEKRFFELSDYMEQMIAHAILEPPPVTALLITQELDEQIAQISGDLCCTMDRVFLDRSLGALEVELNDLKSKFRAAMIRKFRDAAQAQSETLEDSQHSDGTRVRRHISTLLTPLSTKGESL